MPYDFEYYTCTPISSSEARSLLQITRDDYETYMADGILQRSVNLSPERPERFLAHNFWDVIRLKLFLEFSEEMGDRKSELLGALDRLFDDLASALDSSMSLTEISTDFEKTLSSFFVVHANGLFLQGREANNVKKLLDLWNCLELWVYRCFCDASSTTKILSVPVT